jgi:hypothetical protein
MHLLSCFLQDKTFWPLLRGFECGVGSYKNSPDFPNFLTVLLKYKTLKPLVKRTYENELKSHFGRLKRVEKLAKLPKANFLLKKRKK